MKARARLTAFVGHNGTLVELVAGDEWDATHPLVLDRPDLFDAAEHTAANLTPGPIRSTKTAGPIEDVDQPADDSGSDGPAPGATTVTGPAAKPRRVVKRRG